MIESDPEREFEKAVRSHSWTYLRASKGIGSLSAAHASALETLSAMSELASRYSEPHYDELYSGILCGVIPTE